MGLQDAAWLAFFSLAPSPSFGLPPAAWLAFLAPPTPGPVVIDQGYGPSFFFADIEVQTLADLPAIDHVTAEPL